ARLEQGETGLHAEDEERRHQCPDGVDRIDDVVALQDHVVGAHLGADDVAGDEADRAQEERETECLAGQQEVAVTTPLRVTKPLSKARDLVDASRAGAVCGAANTYRSVSYHVHTSLALACAEMPISLFFPTRRPSLTPAGRCADHMATNRCCEKIDLLRTSCVQGRATQQQHECQNSV